MPLTFVERHIPDYHFHPDELANRLHVSTDYINGWKSITAAMPTLKLRVPERDLTAYMGSWYEVEPIMTIDEANERWEQGQADVLRKNYLSGEIRELINVRNRVAMELVASQLLLPRYPTQEEDTDKIQIASGGLMHIPIAGIRAEGNLDGTLTMRIVSSSYRHSHWSQWCFDKPSGRELFYVAFDQKQNKFTRMDRGVRLIQTKEAAAEALQCRTDNVKIAYDRRLSMFLFRNLHDSSHLFTEFGRLVAVPQLNGDHHPHS